MVFWHPKDSFFEVDTWKCWDGMQKLKRSVVALFWVLPLYKHPGVQDSAANFEKTPWHYRWFAKIQDAWWGPHCFDARTIERFLPRNKSSQNVLFYKCLAVWTFLFVSTLQSSKYPLINVCWSCSLVPRSSLFRPWVISYGCDCLWYTKTSHGWFTKFRWDKHLGDWQGFGWYRRVRFVCDAGCREAGPFTRWLDGAIGIRSSQFVADSYGNTA